MIDLTKQAEIGKRISVIMDIVTAATKGLSSAVGIDDEAVALPILSRSKEGFAQARELTSGLIRGLGEKS